MQDFSPLWNIAHCQVRYSIPEELKKGSVVGNIAKDFGLDISQIHNGKLRITSDAGQQYFSVDLDKGELAVTVKTDRETLCEPTVPSPLPLEVLIEIHLQLHRVEIEIQGIIDNPPDFLTKDRILKIAERDRETQSIHRVVLTAVVGRDPV